jgi:glutamyl-tRNA synthetase
MSAIVTRIAPSPTGYMHIGTARTALFNWLYARGHGGKFLVRVEDTDKKRSTPEATKAIFKGLNWLGLDFDDDPVYQASRANRHAEIASQLLSSGHAYKCFSTQEEIAKFRETARADGSSTLFQSPWRDTDKSTHPDAPYAVRIKSPNEGVTVIKDQVQGNVQIKNDQLDDMVLLRSDGSPVYMLAVVVDDHDMGITHVIRGDDHLNNAARQMLIYMAMGWPIPVYVHIPLILGPDGKKLSKRHGATGVEDYQLMGYPASGMRNYLARLGWSHGDDEFFSDAQAKDWFDLDAIGKSAARFDFKKLENLCGQHIARTQDAALLHDTLQYTRIKDGEDAAQKMSKRLLPTLYCIKERAKTYGELIEKANFILIDRPIQIDEKAMKNLPSNAISMLNTLTSQLQNVSWTREELEALGKTVAESFDTNFGKLAGPLRAALAGKTVTPSVFDMMLILGRDETIARLADVTETGSS